MRLPQGVRLPRAGELFHWSGENSERARSKASLDLYHHLRELESRQQPYHLVGHSHGGSVIWGALRLATLKRKHLDHLRSWSTVGTPFLHHRTRNAFDLVNLVNIALALLLLRPAYNAFLGLTKMLLRSCLGLGGDLVVASQESAPAGAFLRTPLLKLAESLGVVMKSTAAGIQIGSYDRAGNQSFFEYLFFTREGLVIVLLVSFAFFVYLQLASFFLSPVLESLRSLEPDRRSLPRQQQAAQWREAVIPGLIIPGSSRR